MDTHIHAASGMNQKHLLRFIKKKIRSNPDDIVSLRDAQQLTLSQVCNAVYTYISIRMATLSGVYLSDLDSFLSVV